MEGNKKKRKAFLLQGKIGRKASFLKFLKGEHLTQNSSILRVNPWQKKKVSKSGERPLTKAKELV